MRGRPTATAAWIKPEDLQETVCCIALRNTTAGTEVEESAGLQVSELLEDGIALRVPSRSCALGHNLMVHISRGRPEALRKPKSKTTKGKAKADRSKALPKPIEVHVTGKVLEEEHQSDEFKVVTLRFQQVVQKEWDRFLEILAERQRAVDRIVRGIRD